MSSNLKEMLVVLIISATLFQLGKPIALKFSEKQDFRRRRNIWFALTAVAFISPNFWLFALVAVPLLIWGARKDTNVVAFYLILMQVIPNIDVEIPAVLVNRFFPLNMYRLLSICVLVPAASKLWRSSEETRLRRVVAADLLLIAYVGIQIALYVPPDLPNQVILADSATNVLRRMTLNSLDIFALYYVVSRYCSTRKILRESFAAFCLSGAIMAGIAIFESLKRWLLYADMPPRWSDSLPGLYLYRGSTLRAMASAGHPLALGYLLAVALGFWLYLQSRTGRGASRTAVALLLWCGLLAAYSRGPWLGAALIYCTFVALGPRPASKLLRASLLSGIAFVAILATPIGDRIINVLPFMGGSVDAGSISYRERIAERSWQLIQQNPLFGDQTAYLKMESLRQGQGIIDLVNTYASVALFYGLIGLLLFVGFILVGMIKVYFCARSYLRSDLDFALLGMSLVACIAGTLVMIASCSLIFGYQQMFYILGAFATAYVYIAERQISVANSSRRGVALGNVA